MGPLGKRTGEAALGGIKRTAGTIKIAQESVSVAFRNDVSKRRVETTCRNDVQGFNGYDILFADAGSVCLRQAFQEALRYEIRTSGIGARGSAGIDGL